MEKERIPKESETIAARRAARLSEKIGKARSGLIVKAWWSNELIEAFGLVLIFSLNFYLIYPFFGTAAQDIPFSGPILPLLTKGVELISSLPFAYALQIVYIAFFLFFPLTFYIFVKHITERKMIALLAVLIVSLPFYPFAELRVEAALIGGDGAHIASLTIIPIALYGLLAFIRKGGVLNFIIASIFSAVVALISPFGALTYTILAAISAFSEMLLGSGRLKLVRLIAVFIVAAGLTSFWFNPGFFIWMITGPMGEEIRAMISRLVPISFFIVPVLAAFGYLLFDRKPNLQPVFLASFFTISFAIISLTGGGIFLSNPSRYVTEFGISLAFLIGVVTVKVVDYLRFYKGSESPNPISSGLIWLNHNYFFNILLIVILAGLISGILFGRPRLQEGNEAVLGIWTGVERGQIWIARDRFDGTSQTLGFTITLISVSSLGVLGYRNRS